MGCVIKYKGQSIPEEQFLQYLNKQIAINNLFNENESLANAVYEALGFKTESSSNTITRDIKEELPFKVIGNYNEIDEGLIGRKFYEEKIGNDLYRFEISNYSYPNEDGSSESFYDIDFTVNGSEEVIGTGFFNKAERAKQILQALLSQNFGNDTVRFNVEESKKGKQRLSLYKRLMNQLGYNPSGEMEYALFYNTNTFLSPSDKIVFGHPTIGKSYLKQKGNNEFITLDDDYADEVNAFVDANRGSETRQEYKGRKPKEYNQFMLNLFDRLKIQAQKEGKKLFVSNTNILKERMSDFDKVITMPKDEFKKRFDARGATYGFEDWKSDIDATVAKVPINKIINTTGYLSDLFKPSNEIGKINLTPQQKQQAQQLYSKYLESLNKPNTNPILQGNQANIEEIITQLEKEGLLEIDCKGKLKAEKGLATSFTKGGKWKVIKDLKGYPTHKEGGVDLTIGKNGVSIKNGNTQFTAKYGLVIPKAEDGMVVPDGEDNPIIEPINEPNVELTNNTFDGGPDDPKIKSKSKKQIYQEAIKNNYKTYVGQGVKTPYMKDGVDTEKGHMNCINGVCTVIEGMGAKKFNSKYSGNAKFSDANEQEGYYIANPENDGFEVGDVIQYARYKNSALSRFPGKVDAKNGYDLYPNHAKVVLDTYKDAEGNNRYILGHNKGTDQFTQEEVSETDLLEVARGKGMNSYNGLIVNRYDPDNVTKLKKENFEATQVLSGKNKYAKDYDTASGIKGVSFETVIDPKKPATYQSTPEANKLVDIYNKNYKAIGKMSDLPPAILNKLIHSQIGIASMESKIGKDEGGVKSLVPDVALPLARKLKDKVSDSDDWMKDYYDKNVKGVKEKYKTLDAFRQKMDEGNRLDKDAREYLYYHSERSKGTFQQKMLSKRGRYMNLDLDNPDQQPLASLNLAIDNFHLLKKKYPNLNEDELVDLTTLMHNAPSKALNQDYVDYYLKNKQIDYVNAVNKKKGKIEENVQTKAKYVPKPIVKNLSKKEVEDLTNFAKKLK